MKSRKQKKQSLSEYKDKLEKAKITIFTSFANQSEAGVGVKSMQALRASLRENESQYVVEKKRIVSKVVTDQYADAPVSTYEGSVGTVFGFGDEVGPAKVAFEFSKINTSFKMFGGIFQGVYIDEARMMTLAQLPSYEVLMSQFIGILSYPIRGLATVLQANIRKLAVALQKVTNNK